MKVIEFLDDPMPEAFLFLKSKNFIQNPTCHVACTLLFFNSRSFPDAK